jgi:anti-sigma regulatory factor (Ser/Thr protein kinase)
MTALSEVAAFTAEACREADLGREVCLRVTLLLEELFSNTVVHGHAGGSDAPVTVTFDAEPGRIRLTYEDTGPPHDPFAAVVQPDDAATVEDWPIGGLGILLVASMATDVEYRRVGDKNCIALTIRTSR